MTQAKDLAELGARYGVDAIREERSKRLALAIEPIDDNLTPLPVAVTPRVQFAEFVRLDPEPTAPLFPLASLPEWMSAWVQEAARVEQVPADCAASLAVGVLAVATMGKAKVDVFGGEPLSLYLGIVDRPGANKSGIFKRATEPLWEWERRQAQTSNAEISAWQVEVALADESIKAAKQALAPKKGGDKLQNQFEAGDAKEKLESALTKRMELDDKRPVGDLRICGDITPESLADLLSQNRCVASLSPEGAEVFDGMGRYQQKGENMEVFLKSWSGDTLTVDRKNGTRIAKVDPTLSIVAMAQPHVLKTLRDPGGARDGRGLLARFLWCVPESRVGNRVYAKSTFDEAVSAEYTQRLSMLCDLAFPVGDIPKVPVDPDADALFGEFYNETERELRAGGELVEVEAMASKMRSHLARIAGLLHLADGRGLGEAIDRITMERAVDVARYFLAHNIIASGMMDAMDDGAVVALRLYHKAVRAAAAGGETVEGLSAVSVRDLAKKVHSKTFPDTGTVEAGIKVLEANGYVRLVDKKPRGKLVVFNPRVIAGTPEGAGKGSGG